MGRTRGGDTRRVLHPSTALRSRSIAFVWTVAVGHHEADTRCEPLVNRGIVAAAVIARREARARLPSLPLWWTLNDRRSYDSDMGMGGVNAAARRWSIWRTLLPSRPDASDAFVELWQKSWMAGAAACWAKHSSENPNPKDPARAAWQAGWKWAENRPNRRTQHHLRLAHPNRRATDPERWVSRPVKIGAFGVGLFAAAGWVWRLRARRKRAGI